MFLLDPTRIASATAAAPMHTLSAHDSQVLSSIINPEAIPNTNPIDPSLPPLLDIPSALLTTLQDREVSILRPLNGPSPSPSDLESAIASLTSLIMEHPNYASAYNNRAQAIRMLLGDDLKSEGIAQSTLWIDLSKAIELAAPSSSHSAVSPLQAKILASAYTHRGYLTWQLPKSMDPPQLSNPQPNPIQLKDQEASLLPPELQGKSKERLEGIASRDFEMGGRYGNETAREMATRTNPYAKLCGNIVKEAMRGEMGVEGA